MKTKYELFKGLKITTEEEMNIEQRNLLDKISDMSEDYYCAGWLNDFEFDVWKDLERWRKSPEEFKKIHETSHVNIKTMLSDIKRVDELMKISKGWIASIKEEANDKGLTYSRVFLSLDDWLLLIQRKQDRGV